MATYTCTYIYIWPHTYHDHLPYSNLATKCTKCHVKRFGVKGYATRIIKHKNSHFAIAMAISHIVYRNICIIVLLTLVIQFGMNDNDSMWFSVAAANDDYDLLQYVYFNNTDTQKCYNISIVQDDICDIDFINNISSEVFYLIMSTYASQVNIEQPRANVSIDDDLEPECGR